MRALTDGKKQIEFFGEKLVVVFEAEAKERVGLYEGAAARDDLSAAMGDQVERGEFLEDAHRVGGAENGDGAGEADVLGARGSRGQDHCRGGVEELGAVMLADAENVEADLVGEFDLLQQMLHALNWAERDAGRWIRDGCSEAVDADLHHSGP